MYGLYFFLQNKLLQLIYPDVHFQKPALLVRLSVAFLATLFAAVLRYALLDVWPSGSAPFLVFFPAVMVSAWYGGFGAGVFAALASMFWAHVLYHDDFFEFNFGNFAQFLIYLLFFVICLQISWLNELFHKVTYFLHQRAKELEKTQNKLIQSTNYVVSIFESMTDAFFALDKNFNFRYINRQADIFFQGKKASQLIGKEIWKEYPYLKRSRVYHEMQKALNLQQKRKFEQYFPKIGYFEFNIYPLPNGVSVYFQDISERKKIEETLYKFAAIVESTDDAIIAKDLEGKVLNWNKGAHQLYGYSEKEVIGKNISIIFPDHKKDEFGEILEVIKMGEGIDHYATQRLTKDGRVIDVSITISPLKTREGKVIGASAIARDISKEKELERRKDSLISMASHELKTPVTTLKVFTQILLKRSESSGDSQSKAFLTKMDSQLTRLTVLINDLLDISKIQEGKLELNKEKFTINDLVKETIENIQAISNQHEILVIGNAKMDVVADRDRIGQVLTNLLTNAIKYSPNSNQVIVNLLQENNNVVVAIKDFGIGIDKKHQHKIFDRFYRVAGRSEKTFPGLGIGLYISSEIIRRHGGHIWVESKKSGGSTFSFNLPLR